MGLTRAILRRYGRGAESENDKAAMLYGLAAVVSRQSLQKPDYYEIRNVYWAGRDLPPCEPAL